MLSKAGVKPLKGLTHSPEAQTETDFIKKTTGKN